MLANVWGPLLVASAAQRCPAKLPPCLLPYPAISTAHRVGATITAGSAAYNAVLRPQLVGSGPLTSHRPLAVEACHIRLRLCEIHAIPSSVSVSSTGACRSPSRLLGEQQRTMGAAQLSSWRRQENLGEGRQWRRNKWIGNERKRLGVGGNRWTFAAECAVGSTRAASRRRRCRSGGGKGRKWGTRERRKGNGK